MAAGSCCKEMTSSAKSSKFTIHINTLPMAEREAASSKGPVKGILKKGGGKAKKGVGIAVPKDGEKTGAIQWDELNIMMTEHPEGKDYGHMKIDEPKTPYNTQEDSGDEGDKTGKGFTEDLAKRVQEAADKPRQWEGESSGSEVDQDDLLTEEQRDHKKNFHEWRKKHYDEFHAVKRARELKTQRKQRKGKGGDDREEGDDDESMDTATQPH